MFEKLPNCFHFLYWGGTIYEQIAFIFAPLGQDNRFMCENMNTKSTKNIMETFTKLSKDRFILANMVWNKHAGISLLKIKLFTPLHSGLGKS